MSELESCFARFTASAFRLETLRNYAVPAEDARFAAFRQGQPMPERSVRTSPWLQQIAATTAAGKSWHRVHVMDHPLSEYERFELACYVESAAAGEEIRIADRAAHPGLASLTRDFWLFDSATDRPFVALMDYDHAGHYTGAEISDDPAVVSQCEADRRLAREHSVPLNAYREIEAA
jgi:hypothetical protein